jgi:hypothetical protein
MALFVVPAGLGRLDAQEGPPTYGEEFAAGVSHIFLSNDQAHPGTNILGQA